MPSTDSDASTSANEQSMQEMEELDNIVPTRGYQMTPMVALGGSAGSIAALQAFFKTMPADSGLIFVVVLHLAPDHHSILAELLARSTKMTVLQAEDGQKVEPNHVYVIPPGKHLATVNGRLRLVEMERERGKRVAVDFFFRTLADTHGPHAAAVVLSGADGDGAIGIKRIKERGGLTIAQDPDEAEHPDMPKTAIDTGMVDWVLPVNEMPHRLLNYVQQEKKIRLPSEEGPQPAQVPRPARDENETALRDVLAFLRSRTGRDFSYYKRATILRRIGRRMQVNNVLDLPGYLSFLRTHPGESGALLQDLLISVTNFFRDRDAFNALETHIPTLFRNKVAGDSVRVWVPACATGEEAYSLAMMLLEHAKDLEAPPAMQVFACDLDEEAIQRARAGLYPDAISADVSEERLRRFFVKDSRGYRVRRELREMVLFAAHDLLKDAPFSRMDLISCRNLLIYLNREAQARSLETFHFALRPQSLLFLGTSESVEDGNTLFRVVDKKNRIFAPQPSVRATIPIPSGPTTLLRALEAHEQAVAGAPVVHGRRFVLEGGAPFHGVIGSTLDRATLTDLHYRMVERLVAPSVLVNAEHEIVHISEHAGEFLRVSGGEPSASLLRLIHPMLRAELRAALFRARDSNTIVDALNVPMEVDGEMQLVNLRVSPAEDLAPGFSLVIFEKGERSSQDPANPKSIPPGTESLVQQLERELELVKNQLRDTVEQYEASSEEMKASNEELQAMNEELRSATEELETSREELQSINEELTTVNQEMKIKVEELASANADLQNLMASTCIATVFLDRSLTIKRYTPQAVDLFHLIPGDLGRPLAHLKHSLEYIDLLTDAEQVLRNLVPIEREVRKDDQWFLARLQPYRTVEDNIGGVVLTFVDVTERKKAEESLADELRDTTILRKVSEKLVPEEDTRSLFDNILSAAIDLTHSDAGTVQLLHPPTGQLRLLVEKGFSRKMKSYLANADASEETAGGRALSSGARLGLNFETPSSDDAEVNALFLEADLRSAQATPLIARSGRPIGMLSIYWKQQYRPTARELRLFDLLARQAADAIERKQAVEAVKASEERLKLLIESAKDYAIFTTNLERCVDSWNPGAEAMFGYTEAEIVGEKADVLFTVEDREKESPALEANQAQEKGRATSERWQLRKDGSVFFGSGSLMAIREKGGSVTGFVKIMRDLTDSKRKDEELCKQIEELRRFNSVAVGRETRMIELKKEINVLCDQAGRPARYTVESPSE